MVAVACFIPGRAKDLSAPPHITNDNFLCLLVTLNGFEIGCTIYTQWISHHLHILHWGLQVFPLLMSVVGTRTWWSPAGLFKILWQALETFLLRSWLWHTNMSQPFPTCLRDRAQSASATFVSLALTERKLVYAGNIIVPNGGSKAV